MRAQLFLVAGRSATNSPGPGSVALGWNPSPDTRATGYFLCWGLASSACTNFLDVGNVTNATVAGAVPSVAYYFTIVTYDAAGDQSPPSNEIVAAMTSANPVVTAWPTASAITYGQTLAASTLSGGSATPTGSFAFTTPSTAPNAGTAPQSVTYTPTDTTNYNTASSTVSVTVNPTKTLTVTGITANDKVYDGNTTATLNTSGATLVGIVSPDVVTLNTAGAPGAFTDPDVGTGKTVLVSGLTLSGADAGNYTLIQPTTTANITPRVVALSGSKTYDGTTTVTAGDLAVANNVDGVNLTLSGQLGLPGKNAGSHAGFAFAAATPTRVQSATGVTPNTGNPSSFAVTLTQAPTGGDTLVAVISTRGTSASRVSSISQSGVGGWTRAAQAYNAGGTTTEIWYGTNVVSAASTSMLITLASSLRSAAVVIEYSGVLTTASPLDQTNSATGNTGASTGTTPITSQANELWVGGIGLTNSNFTLTLTNSFATVASANSTNSTAANNAKVYALEQIVSATGTASSGGTVNTNGAYSGAIATFKAQSLTGLTLGGSAATNYTLVGMTAAVTISPTNLTVKAAANTKTYDGTTSAAATPTITAGSIQPGDAAPVWTETYETKNAGIGKTLTPDVLMVSDGNGGLNYSYTYLPVDTGVIAALASATLLTSDINPSWLTSNVTFTATVAGVPPPADLPTGDVVFSADGKSFATNRLISGSTTASMASLPVATIAMTAQYVGDGNFEPSSGSLAQVVTNSVINSQVCRQVNSIESLVNNGDGTFTLNLLGTPGASYYMVVSGDISAPMALWTALAGSTTTAPSPSGQWSIVVSNAAPAFFRSVAVNPAP